MTSQELTERKKVKSTVDASTKICSFSHIFQFNRIHRIHDEHDLIDVLRIKNIKKISCDDEWLLCCVILQLLIVCRWKCRGWEWNPIFPMDFSASATVLNHQHTMSSETRFFFPFSTQPSFPLKHTISSSIKIFMFSTHTTEMSQTVDWFWT